jgi:hypothetical protein
MELVDEYIQRDGATAGRFSCARDRILKTSVKGKGNLSPF